MPSVRTNLLRLQINSPHTVYNVDIASKQSIEESFRQQIYTYLAQTLPNAIYQQPFLYTTMPLTQNQYHLYLSNGNPVALTLTLKYSNQDSKRIANLISDKLLVLTQLLYSKQLNSCFNPFQEKRNQKLRQIPGLSLQAQSTQVGADLYIIPSVLHFKVGNQMSELTDVLLDYYSGNFFLKQNIVRIDKVKGQFYFRDGTSVSREGLYPISLQPINGYSLAYQIYHYIDRIKNTSKDFCKEWGIKFDSRLVENSYSFIHPGHIAFRGGLQKSLAEIVTPMSEYNFIHNYNGLMNGVCFEDNLQCEVVLFVSQREKQFTLQLGEHIDKLRYRMGINLQTKLIMYSSLENKEELISIVSKEAVGDASKRIFFFVHSKYKPNSQKENIDKIWQFLIENGLYFHSLQVDLTQKQISFEQIATKQTAIIYTKYRLNPWKLKNIPFSNNPMVAISLNIEFTRQKQVSIALVSTMNLFLSKFTAVHRIAKVQDIRMVLEECIRECIDKFNAVHGRFPIRIILFRTGLGQKQDLTEQLKSIKQSLFSQTGSTLTYIALSKDHLLRTFNQIDNNYVSKDSIKRVQLLLYAEIKEQIYIQLELEEPMHRVRIYQKQKNDPNFVTKMLQLMSKVIYGGVGNSFGRGLGFIDYSRKLNAYRQFNLSGWQKYLKDGILLFL